MPREALNLVPLDKGDFRGVLVDRNLDVSD